MTGTVVTLESIYRNAAMYDAGERADTVIRYARRYADQSGHGLFETVNAVREALLGEPLHLEVLGVELGDDFPTHVPGVSHNQLVVQRDDLITTALWKACHD